MIRIIKKFSLLLDKHQKGRVAIILAMMVVGAFLEAIGVGLMVPLVSAVTDEHAMENNKFIRWVCDLLGIESHLTFVLLCIIALILIFVLKNLYLIFEYHIQYRFIFNNRFTTQKRVLDVYMHRAYEFFLNTNSGEIIRVISSDITNSYNLLITLLSMTTELIVTAALVIVVFVISPVITTATGAAMFLTMLLIVKVVSPRLKRAGIRRQDAAAQVNKWMLQSVNGIKDVKISQTEKYFQSNYDANGRVLVNAERRNQVFQNMPRLLIEMISISAVLVVILCLILSGVEVITLAPALSAFAMAAMKLLPSANRISSGLNLIAFHEPALDKLISDIQDMESTTVKNCGEESFDGERKIECPKKMVELADITYHYPNVEEPVLFHANMKVPVGSSVGIVGSTGAGKTTAVDLLLGLLQPQEGRVLCDGVDIRNDYQGWLSHIGYIPQMIFMLDDTIRANVAFGQGNKDADDGKVWEALKKAQLKEFIESLPEGLDTIVGERGIRISGGQRQRISIARALYTNPEILIFDEATSALDNDTEAAIMESVDALHGEKTMVIIAHRLTTIKKCDVIYQVKDGKIIAERKDEYV